MISHCGPSFSKTTYYREEGDLIKTGADVFNQFITQYQNKLVGWVHGHTHDGFGGYKM